MEKVEAPICLDTDLLADFLRNKAYALEWFKKNEEKKLSTTIISVFELFYGAYKSSHPEQSITSLNKLLDRLVILNLSKESVVEAGKQLSRLEQEGMSIDFRDALIATIALTNDISLKTNNRKHFERISGLKLV